MSRALIGVSLALALSLHTGCGLTALITVLALDDSGRAPSKTPTVTGILPTSGAHDGGITVTITGTNFPSDATVAIGGQAATGVVVSSKISLQATLPASPTALPADVVVTNPSGGSGTLLAGFLYTNALPTAAFNPISTPQTQNIVVPLVISDPESDAVDVALDYALGAGPFVPIPAGDIVSGSTTGLASSPGGVSHNVTWNSTGLFPSQNALAVTIRATPVDTTDALAGTAGVSAPFDIINNGAPSLTVVQPGNDSNEVALFYTVADPDATDTLTVTAFNYLDVNRGSGGAATVKSGTPASVPLAVPFTASGQTHAVVWDSFADVGYGNNRLVQLELTVDDGTQSVTVTTAPFFVSNGPLGEPDIASSGLGLAEAMASCDLDADALPDVVISAPVDRFRALSVLINRGQDYAAPTLVPVLGSLTLLGETLTWDGSTTVALGGATTLAVGDWISLPFGDPLAAFMGGDPIGPRAFRVSAVNAGDVTIEDPHSYALFPTVPAGGLLPGSAAFGGSITTSLTRVQRAIPGLGPGTDDLVPNFLPGQLALLSVDETDLLTPPQPPTNDVVVVNKVPPALRSTLAGAAGAGATSITVTTLLQSAVRPFQAFEAGLLIDIDGEPRIILGVDSATSTLSFAPGLAGAHAAGSLVAALDVNNPFFPAPGHVANHSFTVLPTLAGGVLGAPTLTTPTGGYYPQHAFAADVGSPGGAMLPDGFADLIVVNGVSAGANPLQGSVSIFLRNDSAAGFTALPPIPVGEGGSVLAGVATASTHAVAADVTLDGLPDVVVANVGEATISVLIQGPPGTFSEAMIDLKASSFPPGDTISVAVGDLDADGLPDLVATGLLTQRLLVLRGGDPPGPLASFPGGDAANPTLIMVQTPAPPPFVAGAPSTQPDAVLYTLVQPLRVQIGDVNGDGLPDVVVPQAGNNQVTAYVNQGTALGVTGFQAVDLSTSLTPTEVLIQDVNGDRLDDVLVLGTFLSDLARFHQTTPGTLDQFVPFPVGSQPMTLEIGELTAASPGLELVVANNGQGTIQVLGQDGAGGFVNLAPFPPAPDVPLEFQPGALVLPVPSASPTVRTILPLGLALADFDGDSALDVAVSLQALADPLAPTVPGCADILLNMGGLAPLQAVSSVLTADRNTLTIAAGQVTGGPGADVIVNNFEGGPVGFGSLSVYPGDGAGSFLAPFAIDVDSPTGVIARDVDGDGDLDLAVGSSTFPPNFFLIIQDSGVLRLPAEGVPGGVSLPGYLSASFLEVADFDGDGLEDFALSDFANGKLAVAFQDGPVVNDPPTYSTVVSLLSLPEPGLLVAGDLNGDGLPDLAVPFAADGKVGVYYQQAGGGLAAPLFLDCGPNPFKVAIGDLNSDGRNDLAVASRGAGTVNVFFQR